MTQAAAEEVKATYGLNVGVYDALMDRDALPTGPAVEQSIWRALKAATVHQWGNGFRAFVFLSTVEVTELMDYIAELAKIKWEAGRGEFPRLPRARILKEASDSLRKQWKKTQPAHMSED